MTVHRGPFNSVYAGHAALHAIGTGLILTLSHSLPVSIFLLSGSLPVYSCTIRLVAVILRLAACLVLCYQAHILSLSGLLYVYSHSQACYLSILSLSLRLSACLFSCAHSGSLPIYSHSHSGSLPVYSYSIRLAACLFSLHQARCLSILTLSGSLSIYSHTHVTVSICFHT